MDRSLPPTHCVYCDKTMPSMLSYKVHISRNHRWLHKFVRDEEKRKNRTCIWCQEVFSKVSNRKSHQETCIKQLRKLSKFLFDEDIYQDIDEVGNEISRLNSEQIEIIKAQVEEYKAKRLKNKQSVNPWFPINADVTKPEVWDYLEEQSLKQYGKKFDVLLIDPPWSISKDLPYPVMTQDQILNMPLHKVQTDGYMFLWVVNQKQEEARAFIKKHGYTEVDTITWVKTNQNNKLKIGWGRYALHCTEKCLICKIGKAPDYEKLWQILDVIISPFTTHSQKPKEIYEYIEMMVPDGKYLEIFARKTGQRNGWVAVGNEL